MSTITNKIIKRIRGKQRGWVFTPRDFLDIGLRAAVDKVLSRLASAGLIRRLARGVYDFPKQHTLLGTLSPNMDNLAKVTAKAGDIVFQSGAMSANILGLSTQVPARQVYLTSGKSHRKNIGGRLVVLKHTRSLLNNVTPSVNLAVQALSYIGKDNIDDAIIQKCAKILSHDDRSTLVTRAKQLPGWLADVVHKIEQASRG
jgi:predicted transcriptional regulator of viral defense system